jgi:hypothetical protein
VLELGALGIIAPKAIAALYPSLRKECDVLQGSVVSELVGWVFQKRWLRKIDEARAGLMRACEHYHGNVEVRYTDLTSYGLQLFDTLQKLRSWDERPFVAAFGILEKVGSVAFDGGDGNETLSSSLVKLFDNGAECTDYLASILLDALNRGGPRSAHNAGWLLDNLRCAVMEPVAGSNRYIIPLNKWSDLDQLASYKRSVGYRLGDHSLDDKEWVFAAGAFVSLVGALPIGILLGAVTGNTPVGIISGLGTAAFLAYRFVEYEFGIRERINRPAPEPPRATAIAVSHQYTIPAIATRSTSLSDLASHRDSLPPVLHPHFDQLLKALIVANSFADDPKVGAAVRSTVQLGSQLAKEVRDLGTALPTTTEQLVAQAFYAALTSLQKALAIRQQRQDRDVTRVELTAAALISAAGGFDAQIKRSTTDGVH